jgi:hypothetical protein
VLETNAEDFVRRTSRRAASSPRSCRCRPHPLGAATPPRGADPHLLPRAAPGPDFAACCADPGPPMRHRPPCGSAGAVTHGTTVCRRPLRRRRGDGRRPPGHLGQPDQPPLDREGVPGRPHSGVAIAGAAGPAMEMVKLFQLQLEHYEKVEGRPLSLEGKANQLSHDGAQPPAGRHAGHGRRADLRRVRHCAGPVGCSSTTSPAVATRRTTTPPPAPAACTPPP